MALEETSTASCACSILVWFLLARIKLNGKTMLKEKSKALKQGWHRSNHTEASTFIKYNLQLTIFIINMIVHEQPWILSPLL